MKHKKLINLLLVVVMLISLVGCGSETPTTNTQEEQQQNIEQQEPIEEEIIDADGKFEIEYIYELDNGTIHTKEDNHIYFYLYDNDGNEIYSNILFKNSTTEELFVEFENVVTEEMVLNFIDEHFETTLSVWSEGNIPDDKYEMDEYPQNIDLNLGNANFNFNIKAEEGSILSITCQAANSDRFDYDYVLVRNDTEAKSLCGFCFELTGTYTCDLDVNELVLNTQGEEPSFDQDNKQEYIEIEGTATFEYFETWSNVDDDYEAITRVYLNDNYPNWSVENTHYVDVNGNEMNFKCDSPKGVGQLSGTYGNTLSLVDKDMTYELRAWYGGDVSEEDFAESLEFTKETWVSFASSYTPYVENGYYDYYATDTTIETVFAVESDTQKGYNYYIVDLTRGVCYQFAYLEDIEVYNDKRAIQVIYSFDFWDDYSSEE